MSAPICMTELTVTWQDDSSTAVCFRSLSERQIHFFLSHSFHAFMELVHLHSFIINRFLLPPVCLSFCSLLCWLIYRINVVSSGYCSSSSLRQWVSGWPHQVPAYLLGHFAIWFRSSFFSLLPVSLSCWCCLAIFPKTNWVKRRNVGH